MLSLVGDTVPGYGCGSPNHTCIWLVLFFCLFTNHLLLDTKKKEYCIKSKANHSYSHNKITGTHHALVRDCFSPSTASVRYRLPAVITFKFTSLYHPSYPSPTVPEHTLPAQPTKHGHTPSITDAGKPNHHIKNDRLHPERICESIFLHTIPRVSERVLTVEGSQALNLYPSVKSNI
jgi:hypothetical protein